MKSSCTPQSHVWVYNKWVQLPDAIDKIRPSIVQIRVLGPGMPPQGHTVGTGFVVTDAGHVVTALHVVQPLNPAAGHSLAVAFAGPSANTPAARAAATFVQVAARVIDTNPDHDLAIIETSNLSNSGLKIEFLGQSFNTTPSPVQLHADTVRDGISLAVSGYPLNEPSLVTNAGVLASTFTVALQEGQLRERYLGDLTANFGNSGGPVYTVQDAAVIGVHVSSKLTPISNGQGHQTAGLTVIVPAAEVKALLEKNSLSLPERRPIPPKARKNNRQRGSR